MKRLIAALALAPTVATAHPGDHHFVGMLHLITEPDHLAMIGLGIVALVYTVYRLRARS